MHCVQARGRSPIATAYEEGRLIIRPVRANTIAKSLGIGNPADGYYALKTIEASGGSAVIAEEHEVAEGIKLLAEADGIFTEGAGGVAVAGLKRLVERGTIKPDEPTVIYITGNGLKTTEVVEDVVHPIHIEETVAAFQDGLIKEPVVYQLGHKFDIVTNIRRADIQEGIGWVILELEGDDA